MKCAAFSILLLLVSFYSSAQEVPGMMESGLDIVVRPSCSSLAQNYFQFLNKIGDSAVTFMDKLKISKAQRPEIFLSDSTVVFDDLYLYENERQYFTLNDYLMTIASWYPHGVHFELLESRFFPCQIHKSKPWITLDMAIMRSLRGLDYFGNLQLDTLTLLTSLVFQVCEEGGNMQLIGPRILSITLLELSTEQLSSRISVESEHLAEATQPEVTPLQSLKDSEESANGNNGPIPETNRNVNLFTARQSLMESTRHARSHRFKKIKKTWEL